MTPPLYAGLDDQIVSALARLSRSGSALLGWIEVPHVVREIPDPPSADVLDIVMRRLARRGRIELWAPERPPTSARQMIRAAA